MYSQFSLIRLKTNNKSQNINSTNSFGNFIITGKSNSSLSKHLISSITTIEQSLHKQLIIHCDVLLKTGVPEKKAESLERV